jgi:hypothetical protein
MNINIMKKLILLFLAFCAISCTTTNVEPIQKYKGFIYVGWSQTFSSNSSVNIYIKNTDTVRIIRVLKFDVKNLKAGDTIK